MDSMYANYRLRQAAAAIIRHCNSAGHDASTGKRSAYLRDDHVLENAGAMLARRGFGTLARSTVAGRGHVFTLRGA